MHPWSNYDGISMVSKNTVLGGKAIYKTKSLKFVAASLITECKLAFQISEGYECHSFQYLFILHACPCENKQ